MSAVADADKKIELRVEEHTTNYIVAVVLTGTLKDVASYVENYMREFMPSKFNTQVISRQALDEKGTRVEWVVTRNKQALRVAA